MVFTGEPFAGESAANIHQAGAVAAGAYGCAGLLYVGRFIGDHRTGNISVFEGEGSAEAAALVKASIRVLNTFNGAHQILLTGSQVQQAHAVA